MLCFVLFSATFTAHAATEDVASTIDNIQLVVFTRNSSTLALGDTLLNETVEAGKWGIQHALNLYQYRWSDTLICENFIYTKGENNLIASEGTSIHFNLSGIYNKLTAQYNGTNYEKTSVPSGSYQIRLMLYDQKGTAFYDFMIPKSSFTSPNSSGYADTIDFKVDNLESDLYKIDVEVRFRSQAMFPLDSTVWNNCGSYKLAFGLGSKTMLQVFVDDGQTGLLKGILSGITELPSKIWGLIENGLKGLFVPTEAQMTDVKGQWDTLLSDRFGGLYQTVQLIDDYADTFKQPSQSQSSIDFPEFRLNVGSDSEFVLQAHDVQIIPDRFTFLVDVLKTIISIIATCLFVNGLRNKFERLVGGQE